MKLKVVLKDFNILSTTSRGTERQICYELTHLLKDELGDPKPEASKTGIRGLVVAKTCFDPYSAIAKLREILQNHPYKFRYALRIIPIEKVVTTNLDEVMYASGELAAKIKKNETFRITVEKRYTNLHTKELVEAAVIGIDAKVGERKVDLENPDRIILIEVIGGLTGLACIQPTDILFVLKEKML